MRGFDFSSWQAALTTLFGLLLFTLIGVGIRVIMMQTIQQRRERMNRQINERLRTLIAAYRTLGGSFTGELTVDPTHMRDLRTTGQEAAEDLSAVEARTGSERSRRIRDAVEGALADILLLGTEAQCRMAAQAATDMAAGRPIHTAELVIALRDFIREALDLGPMPGVAIPLQGPTRVQGGGGARGRNEGGKGGGGGGGGGGGDGGGGGLGAGLGLGLGRRGVEHDPPA